jgi:hypothetical protein
VTFGLGNRCSILLSYGTNHAVDVPKLRRRLPTPDAAAFPAGGCDGCRPIAL